MTSENGIVLHLNIDNNIGDKVILSRASAFFDTSDGKNANLIINSQIEPPDMLITVTSGNKYAGISP